MEEIITVEAALTTLGGGWERAKVQRAAKRYNDDRHSEVIGLKLLMLAAVIMATKAPPPPNEHTSNDKETAIVYARVEHTRSSASCEARWIRSSMVLSTY